MRNSNIEFLRILLMFLIVMAHVLTVDLAESFNDPFLFYLKIFLIKIAMPTVNCFVFISGFYGVNPRMKTILHIVAPALFYSISITAIFGILGYKIEPLILLKSLFPISSGLWWFASAYVALIFISPALNLSIKHLSREQAKYMLAGLLFLNCFGSFMFINRVIAGTGYTAFNFIVIYLLARYMATYKIEIKHSGLIFIIYLISAFVIDVIFCKLGFMTFMPSHAHSNPLVIMGAVSMFYLFYNIKSMTKYELTVNSIAGLTFGVYLIQSHVLFVKYIRIPVVRYINEVFSDQPLSLISFTMLLVIIIFAVCLLIERVRMIITNPIENKIKNKLSQYPIYDLFASKNYL